MSNESLIFRSATELAALIGQGQVSAVQVVEAHLRQIHRWNSQINAIVTLAEDSARREAEAADRKRRDGAKLGPLHGVPLTLKDGIRVGGMRSTYGGLPPFLFHVPRRDCTLVDRLRQAGAIIIGRSNLPLMALDWQCHNPFFKEGKNPWDVARTPGGSSGGAAAALAAGFTPLELGSDLGGSIRYPAHCCGVLGLRTSDGLLPIDDAGPEGLAASFPHLLSFGPMARSIADLALMLDVLTATPSVAALPVPGRLRIAITTSWPGAEPSPETIALLDGLAAGLRRDGHQVASGAGPDVPTEDAWRVWGTLAGHILWNGVPGFLRLAPLRSLFQSYMLHRNLGEGPFTKWFKVGMTASKKEYEQALAQREGILQSVGSFFQAHDLWILPVCMGEAIVRQPRGSDILVKGQSVPYSVYLGAYTVPTTAFGTPVLTVPIGYSTSGMPIGVQVHGARFSDRRLLDLVAAALGKYIKVQVPPNMIGLSP